MTQAPNTTAAAPSRQERTRRVETAMYSLRMEGLDVSAAGRADAQEYVEGHIDSHDLLARARSRHGLS